MHTRVCFLLFQCSYSLGSSCCRDPIRSRPTGIVQASRSDIAQGCFLATSKFDLFVGCIFVNVYISYLTIVCIPSFISKVGFLISIDKRQHSHDEATNTFPTVPEDFEFVFVQDHDAFFKSDEMNQLDEEIGDLDAFIKDTEALIVSDLEEEILECESELRTTFSMLADLDCILSLAGCAVDLNFVRPEICPAEVGVISIENGRHPLQELIVNDEFIPNDTLMDNNNRVMIVTGPNFSGKSCYARQVGILVYLTHIGSYLPCDSAKISIMDQIIVNFGDVETCSVPQSTFQRDLTQMAGIMRKSTPNSLVLIDEFGKGKFLNLIFRALCHAR